MRTSTVFKIQPHTMSNTFCPYVQRGEAVYVRYLIITLYIASYYQPGDPTWARGGSFCGCVTYSQSVRWNNVRGVSLVCIHYTTYLIGCCICSVAVRLCVCVFVHVFAYVN